MAGSEPPRLHNLSYAALAGQAGCVTLLVVFGALLAGLWLDARLGQRGPCVFGLLIVSVPVSLALMLRVALGAIRRITPPPGVQHDNDETSSKEV
ncbi:MAG: hypothetical protein BroJett033_8820 [Chloroflexota bacterium]|nr:MAG: hypothetical protein BroJett033_8820 [Chloroflexota bacterium]